MTAFDVRFDFRQALDAAERVERSSGAALVQAGVRAVNATARRYEQAARDRITTRYNLDPAYVKGKFDLKLAERDPKAEIVVAGPGRPSAAGLTILGRYGPIEYKLAGAQRRAGAVRGQRSAGVGVEIRRGAPLFEEQWFLMRLKRGNVSGTNIGVFVRTSANPKKPKHIYGPSPYSAFRQDATFRQGEIVDDLERSALAELLKALEA